MNTNNRNTFAIIFRFTIAFFCGLALLLTYQSGRASSFDIPAGDVNSLKSAIIAANANPDPDIINLQPGIYLLMAPYYGDTGLPYITSDITINGNGATIERSSSATAFFRIFFVDFPGKLSLNDLTLSRANVNFPNEGGGILNYGSVVLNHCIVDGKHSISNGKSTGLTNKGIMTINNSTVTDNYGYYGGGVTNERQLIINDSSITNNFSGTFGGGIKNGPPPGAVLTITNSIISNNSSDGHGGGIDNDQGRVDISNSTISNNSALSINIGGSSGGGIYTYLGSFTIINSTITYNSSSRGGGGGIASASPLRIQDSNVINNYANNGGGGISNFNNLSLYNNIISNNGSNSNGGAIFNRSGIIDAKFNCFSGNSNTSVFNNDNPLPINLTPYSNNATVNEGALTTMSGSISDPNPVDLTYNWWGSSDGPSGIVYGHGDSISNNVKYMPFLINSAVACGGTENPNVIPFSSINLEASVGEMKNNYDGTWSWSFLTHDGPQQTGQALLTADNSVGGFGSANLNITVNNVPPTAVFTGSQALIKAGESIEYSFTDMNDPSTDDTSAGFYYSFDCTNDGIFELSDSRVNSYACVYASVGNYSAKGKIRDKDNGISEYLYPITVMESNNPPTVITGGPYQTNEGASITVSAFGSDPEKQELVYKWDFDSDGIFETQGQNVTFSAMNIDGPATKTISVKATDPGGLSTIGQTTVTILNVAPISDFEPMENPTHEGKSATLIFANIYDPSGVDNQAGFLYSIDCDGDSVFETIDSPTNTLVCNYIDDRTYIITGRVKDKDGGYSDYSTQFTITNIAPISSILLTPGVPEGNSDWYVSGVHVDVTASDNPGGSGLAETRCVLNPSIIPLTFDEIPIGCIFINDGSNVSSDGQYTIYVASMDNAGNKEIPIGRSFQIDLTPPTISLISRTPPNVNGWNNTEVSLVWHCSDYISGVDADRISATISDEGENLSATGKCTDKAGHIASDTQTGISIDKTDPTITVSALKDDGTIYIAGSWTNHSVVVHFQCGDAGSGVNNCSSDEVVNSDGIVPSISGTVMDKAGNRAEVTFGPIQIDKMSPTIQFVNRTAPNDYGWNNSDVTIYWECTDSGSGVKDGNISVSISSEGKNQSVIGTCEDLAGNNVSATQTGINIDKTPPVLNPTISPNPVILRGTATVNGVATDSLSGIASSACSSIDTTGVGSKTVNCTATDKADNTSTASVTYNVIYRFDGFLQPINDTAHSQLCGSPCPISIFKGGSTVPVKFQLKDANGNIVQAGTAPLWVTPQKGGPTNAPIDESFYSDPSTNGVTYEWDGQQYHYNWKTKDFTIGYYWRIGVTFDDGQTYYVYIGLR